MAPVTSIRRRVRDERGAELIEMALVLPLLLLVIVGIIDFGFMFRKLSVVTNAAREGARAGILPEYTLDTNVQARVQQYLNASGLSVSCPSSECVVASPVVPVDAPAPLDTFNAREVQVTVFHQFSFLQPIAALVGGSFSSISLTGRAVMRLESGS